MKSKIFTVLAIIASVCAIGYAAWNIIETLTERYASKQEYEQVRESYVSLIGDYDLSDDEEEDDDGFPDLSIDIDGLLEQNEDFVAWIYYEEADISYPVVQENEDDINGYLYVTFEGESNSSGCIFMPYDAASDFSDLNTFIYGHNMANGSMFGTLKKIYQNPADTEDPYFYIYTKDYRVLKYRVITAYIVQQDSEMYAVPLGSESYSEYLNKAFSLGRLDSYIPFTEEEEEAMENASPLVTLSTCYGAAGTSKRLLVQGVLVKEKDLSEQ